MAPDPVRNEPPPSCLAPLAVHWRVASEQQTTRAAMRRSAPMQRAASPRHRPLAWRDRQSPTDSPHASSGRRAPHTWFKGSAVRAPDKVAASPSLLRFDTCDKMVSAHSAACGTRGHAMRPATSYSFSFSAPRPLKWTATGKVAFGLLKMYRRQLSKSTGLSRLLPHCAWPPSNP